MELYYLCIDFVFQFIVEKYRNKLNQINWTIGENVFANIPFEKAWQYFFLCS